MDGEQTLGPSQHTHTDNPYLENHAGIREEIEIAFEDRTIYKDPRLTNDEMVEALIKTNRADIVKRPVYPDTQTAIDNSPGVLVPTDQLLKYGKVVREAAQFFAETVMLPKGKIREDEIPNFVKKYTHYALEHERSHVVNLPTDARERGIKSYFKISFFTLCEIVGEKEDNTVTLNVDDGMCPSVVLIDPLQVLTAEERVKIITGPGSEKMSLSDIQKLDVLNKSTDK